VVRTAVGAALGGELGVKVCGCAVGARGVVVRLAVGDGAGVTGVVRTVVPCVASSAAVAGARDASRLAGSPRSGGYAATSLGFAIGSGALMNS
jgi:hypothetical protein